MSAGDQDMRSGRGVGPEEVVLDGGPGIGRDEEVDLRDADAFAVGEELDARNIAIRIPGQGKELDRVTDGEDGAGLRREDCDAWRVVVRGSIADHGAGRVLGTDTVAFRWRREDGDARRCQELEEERFLALVEVIRGGHDHDLGRAFTGFEPDLAAELLVVDTVFGLATQPV
ncbi:MAG: hypothetical protein M5U12_27940 [Verrucomicrobia bacterium]|nr:hypothetical protein [Verrucomicrobiota bacterium]